jgi:O-antigen ligase
MVQLPWTKRGSAAYGAPPPAAVVPLARVAALVTLTAVGCALIAVGLAENRPYVQLVAVCAIAAAIVGFAVRDRHLLILVALVLTSQRLFYKLIGPIDPEIAGGVPGLYVTSVDALLLLLYGIWLAKGTFLQDLRDALARPAISVPILATLTVLPSFLVAEDPWFSLSELVRMVWMLALYLYTAVRVRERRELVIVLVALFTITFLQSALAAAQWATQSSLGLVHIGDDRPLVTRVADDAETIRPSGTVLHPVFLSVLMAEIGMLALAVGMSVRERRFRAFAYASVAAAVAGMVLTQTRVAFFAAAAVSVLLILWGAWRGYLSWRAITMGLATAAIGVLVLNGAVMHGSIMDGLLRNFASEHVGVEIEARQQVNQVGLDIAADAPLIGIGLNNYERVLPRYDVYGMGLPGAPPHNLYLLVLADTGAVGLLGMIGTFVALVLAALRLAWVADPMLAAVGVGALAMYGFYALEEMTTFTLRHDVPLLGFWILAGLVLAALRIAEREASGPAPASTLAVAGGRA